jgi:deoxyribonuclease V
VIVALDVDYRADAVVTGCVGFAAWTDPAPARELVVRSAVPPAAYEPGRFYERELPYLRGALAEIAAELVVIDGHVWLAANAPGLGAHLHAAIGVPVVGVAKNPFRGSPAIAVLRGNSAKPLQVTSVGIDANDAAAHVRAMHGEFRIPTLLKRADSLARGR